MIPFLAGLMLTTSCEKDMDSNPTLATPSSFVLNTPALANSTYDLSHSKTIELTCTQPDYGFPAATSYAVQISLNENMEDAVELDTKYTTARMHVDAMEMAVALTQKLVDAGRTEVEFPVTTPLYVRLRASLGDSIGEVFSNVVLLKNVRTSFALPPVKTPENLYAVGSFCDWNWDRSVALAPVNGATHIFWHLIYIDGAGFKFNATQAWNGTEVGFGKLNSIDDAAGAGIQGSGGNIIAANPGWYLFVVTTSVKGRNVVYDAKVLKPEVYLKGSVMGGNWNDRAEGSMFTVPATAEEPFVSPAFLEDAAPDSGVRAYVKIDSYDWWKTEFMVFDGVIKYRGNGGDQDRIVASKGQKLYLNFATDTGKIE